MTEEFIVNIIRESFYTMLLVSAPVLIATLVVGLIISVFQAATSIQEFTITFVPKLIVVGLVLVIMLPWMIQMLVTFTRGIFEVIPTLAK
jgi:flagellar biosynthetic protein FliQ